jgi:hypothetical protein
MRSSRWRSATRANRTELPPRVHVRRAAPIASVPSPVQLPARVPTVARPA